MFQFANGCPPRVDLWIQALSSQYNLGFGIFVDQLQLFLAPGLGRKDTHYLHPLDIWSYGHIWMQRRLGNKIPHLAVALKLHTRKVGDNCYCQNSFLKRSQKLKLGERMIIGVEDTSFCVWFIFY